MIKGFPGFGHGCDHCERGVPITRVQSPGRTVNLCLECTLAWFPQWTVEDFEERHSRFANHVKDAS